MSEKEECEHKNKSFSYGFGSAHGFKGLGDYEYCEDCYERFSFQDDLETNTKEEIEHNKKQRTKVFGSKHNNQESNGK